MECHRLKRQNRFADSVHRFDLLLETARGSVGAELTATVYIDRQGRAPRNHSINAIDKRCYAISAANPDSVVLAGKTSAANVDVIIARSEIGTGERSNCNVKCTGGIT